MLLLHRQHRDDHACKEKYGDDWDEVSPLLFSVGSLTENGLTWIVLPEGPVQDYQIHREFCGARHWAGRTELAKADLSSTDHLIERQDVEMSMRQCEGQDDVPFRPGGERSTLMAGRTYE